MPYDTHSDAHCGAGADIMTRVTVGTGLLTFTQDNVTQVTEVTDEAVF